MSVRYVASTGENLNAREAGQTPANFAATLMKKNATIALRPATTWTAETNVPALMK
jgi:hypothetical protein